MDSAPHINGNASVYDQNGHHNPHQDKLEVFRRVDADRHAFIEELMRNYADLQLQYQEKCNDFENEKFSRRLWQEKADQAQRNIQSIQHNADLNRFVMVLIDGDGAVFQDQLYRAGAEGGADAAYQLDQRIKRHVKDLYPEENTTTWQIVVNIFFNSEGLIGKLRACGILQHPSEFPAFSRAFSVNQPLFNMIDVGVGKERADYKLREFLRLFLYNMHCRHIVLGGISHDYGYIPMLEPMKRDLKVSTKISILETYAAHETFRQLGYPIFQAPSIFRAQNLPERPGVNTTPLPTRTMPIQEQMTSPIIQPFPPPQAVRPPPGLSMTPPPSAIMTPPTAKSIPMIPVSVSPAPSMESGVPIGGSWATVSKKGGNVKEVNVSSKKGPQPRSMLMNSYEERVDPDLPRPDPSAVQRMFDRINRTKVCNAFHLIGKCDKGDYCDYDHGERLTPGEQLALKHHARRRCCPQMSQCFNFDCLFGHTCPHGLDCTNKHCPFDDVHGVDKRPLYKWYENGKKETLKVV